MLPIVPHLAAMAIIAGALLMGLLWRRDRLAEMERPVYRITSGPPSAEYPTRK